MDKNVYICKTPFQIITALMIHKFEYSEDSADIIICSSVQNYKNVAEEIKKTEIFEGVYAVSLEFMKQTRLMCKGVLNPKCLLKNAGLFKTGYSRIFTHGLYNDFDNALFYFNNSAEVILFDEGYSSYMISRLNDIDRFSKGHKFLYKLSKVIYKRKYISDNVKKIYLYEPMLCPQKLPFEVHKINVNKMRMKEYISLINGIFNVESVLAEFDLKYIFFEESFGSDFDQNGDMDIVKYIANVVGKDNLQIKLHPRDKSNRFESSGFNTNKSVGVPWEAIALNISKESKCLITFSSGAVVSYTFLCDDNNKTIFLYKLFPDSYIKKTDQEIKWLDNVCEMYKDKIFAPGTKDELMELLIN